MIDISNVTKSFGKQRVLHDISFHFDAGHVYGLVGTNGCGKTTLMRCMCGLTKADAGTITVLGKIVGRDVDFAPSVGVIIEAPGFLPHYSATRNLMTLAKISGKADKSQVEMAIRKLGLDPTDRKPVGKYSLGMRQRLGIAQAIMENPDILILDEPFNGLDADGNAEIHRLLQELRSEGKCIILASHSRYDIETACDTLCTLENGKLTCSDAC